MCRRSSVELLLVQRAAFLLPHVTPHCGLLLLLALREQSLLLKRQVVVISVADLQRRPPVELRYDLWPTGVETAPKTLRKCTRANHKTDLDKPPKHLWKTSENPLKNL